MILILLLLLTLRNMVFLKHLIKGTICNLWILGIAVSFSVLGCSVLFIICDSLLQFIFPAISNLFVLYLAGLTIIPIKMLFEWVMNS